MAREEVKKIRTCLKCSKEFGSTGFGNRLCPKCQSTNNSVSVMKTMRSSIAAPSGSNYRE